MHCVEILRELAAGGRSIITTIHQPSSRLYQSLDKLLLLSQVRSFEVYTSGISTVRNISRSAHALVCSVPISRA